MSVRVIIAKPRRLRRMNRVEVWHVPLALDAVRCRAAEAWLDEGERERARRLVRPPDRVAYTAAHAALRGLLAARCDERPARLRFAHGQAGKPQLDRSAHPGEPQFNLSHSGMHALIALGMRAPVGIDLEVLAHAQEHAGELSGVFCPQEQQEIATLPVAERALASLRCWTRKEAVLKAVGCGFQVEPTALRVSTGPEARLLSSQHAAIDAAAWSLETLDRADHWAGALAVAGPAPTVTWREWDWEVLA